MADAVRNDIVSGLRGFHTNMSISREQLEQDIIDMRLLVIKEFQLKGISVTKDLLTALNCIPVDCENLSRCKCNKSNCGSDPIAHFEIPQILTDYLNPIQYIGSTDRLTNFLIYTKPYHRIQNFLKYRKRGKNRPWVYVDLAPNSRGMLDCFIFNAPLIKSVSVIGVFKDPRQLEGFNCDCSDESEDIKPIDENINDNQSFINQIIKERVTKEKIRYYRQLAAPITPNNQEYSQG